MAVDLVVKILIMREKIRQTKEKEKLETVCLAPWRIETKLAGSIFSSPNYKIQFKDGFIDI